MRRALLLGLASLGAASLAGCTLIDQRTFNPDAGKKPELPKPPPAAVTAPPEPGPPPLLSIRLPLTASGRGEIAQAVAAARKRKADVVFDVVEITPEAGASVGVEAAQVGEAIVAQGVSAARVHLGVRPVAGAGREVRVFVR